MDRKVKLFFQFIFKNHKSNKMKDFIKIKISGLLFRILIYSLIITICGFMFNLKAQEKDPTEILLKINENEYLLHDILINTKERSITLPARVNMDSGLIEVVLCRPEGKTHESLLVTNVTPVEFNTSLLLLGFDPVNKVPDDPSDWDPLSPYRSITTTGDTVFVFIEMELNGHTVKKPVEDFIYDKRTGKSLVPGTWLYLGAVTHYTGHIIMDNEVSMIVTYHDPIALMELNEKGKYNDEYFYVNEASGLIPGQEVRLIIKAINKLKRN